METPFFSRQPRPVTPQEALQRLLTRAESVARATPMPLIHGDLSVWYQLESRTLDTAKLFPEDDCGFLNRSFHYIDLALAPPDTAYHYDGWRAGIILDSPRSHKVARGFSVAESPNRLKLYQTRSNTTSAIGDIACGQPFPAFKDAMEIKRPRLEVAFITHLISLITTDDFQKLRAQEQGKRQKASD